MRSDKRTVSGVYHSDVKERYPNKEQPTFSVQSGVLAAGLKESEVSYSYQEYTQTCEGVGLPEPAVGVICRYLLLLVRPF